MVSPRRHQAHRRVVYRLSLGGKMLAAHVCEHVHLPQRHLFGRVFVQAVRHRDHKIAHTQARLGHGFCRQHAVFWRGITQLVLGKFTLNHKGLLLP